MQITCTQYAWIDPSYQSMESIQSGKRRPLLDCSKSGDNGYFEQNGHVCIGHASVTLTIDPVDKIAASQIAGLNVQLQAIRAEAQQKENQILLQISKLQALTMG